VIHTHSKAAVMATLVYPGHEFSITHQEMIKGIQKCTSGGCYRYFSIFKKRGMLFDHLFSAIQIDDKSYELCTLKRVIESIRNKK